MYKIKKVILGTLFITIWFSQSAFTLHSDYHQMQKADQAKLETACDLLYSEDSKRRPVEASEEFSKIIMELSKKYPKMPIYSACYQEKN